MENKNTHVCAVSEAGFLDNVFRKLVHNPQKILKGYVKEGMEVLDFGCGPGFFTMEIARMVGELGKVLAVDLQEGMLERLEKKIKGNKCEGIIQLHKCDEDEIGISGSFDFILAFYVLHELPNTKKFFEEAEALLKQDGKLFIADPKFHCSKRMFQKFSHEALGAGLHLQAEPKIFFSRAAIFKK